MDCLMSFPDFLYAFQTQFFYEGKVDVLGILNLKNYAHSLMVKLYNCIEQRRMLLIWQASYELVDV